MADSNSGLNVLDRHLADLVARDLNTDPGLGEENGCRLHRQTVCMG
jgi:hypothetical protein